MQFDSLSALIEMGGHGAFVWSAYALALVTLLITALAPLRRSRKFFAEQRTIELRREQRAASATHQAP